MEKRFGDIAEFVNGRAFKPEDWGTKGLPIIRIQNLTGTNAIFNYYEGEFDKRYLVKNDDILISWSASLGVYRWDKEDAVLNQHIFKVNLKNGIDKTYFYYAVQEKLIEMGEQVHGSTMKHITKDKFDNLKISVPHLKTQQKIAGILEQADAARQKRKQANQLTEQFLQSAFLEMFGDPVRNEKRWEIDAMKNVCSFSQGIQVPIENQKLIKENGYNRFLRISDYTTLCEERFVDVNDARYFVKKDDLVMVRYGASAGFIGIGKEGILANNLFKLNHDRKLLNHYFLFHFLQTDYFKSFIQKVAFGAAMPALSFTVLNDFKIIIPPLPVQQKFANIVEHIEQLRNKQRESEKELENLFGSLMQRYLG